MEENDFQKQILSLSTALHGFSRRFCSSDDDREDLTQDTLLKAWVNKDKFRTGTNLKAWVFTIMRNTYINNFNKRQKRKTFTLSEDISEHEQQYFVNSYTPEDYLNKQEFTDTIDDLDSSYQNPLNMYHEGFKYEEIAEKLSVPVGTVKNRIFTARKKVIEKFK